PLVVSAGGLCLGRGRQAGPAGPGEPARHAVGGHLVAVRREPRDAGRRLHGVLGLPRLHPDADPAGRMALPAGRRRDARVHRADVGSDARPGRVQRVAQLAALIGVAALLGLLIWKVAFGRTTGAADELAEGKLVHAPAFTLDRLDRDGQLAVGDLKGKAVVVNFWASWCVPCRDDATLLQQTYERSSAHGLVVLGVDVNDFRQDA